MLVLVDQPKRRCTVAAFSADPGGYPCVHLLGTAGEADFELLVPKKKHGLVDTINRHILQFLQ